MIGDANRKTKATHLIVFQHSQKRAENSGYKVYRHTVIDSKIHSVKDFINIAMQKCIAEVRKE